MPRLHRARLLLSHPYDVPGRQFAAARRLVDIGGLDLVGNDADLAQQIEPARRGRGEHQFLHRGSTAQVQHADQREQAARRIVIDRDFAGQPVGEQFRALVMQ